MITHAVKTLIPTRLDIAQKRTETSLIERFLYPKYGPGQLWEKVANLILSNGGAIQYDTRVVGIHHSRNRILSVEVETPDRARRTIAGDYFFSSMPIKELVAGLKPMAPALTREIADGLAYRDFITVGLLLEKLRLGGGVRGSELPQRMPDNWIYVQEPHVKVGRLQIFNNWSPYMVADPEKIWIGLEYFVNEGDGLWSLTDQAMSAYAVEELVKIGVVGREDVLDSVVIRMPKTYPAYFGTYNRFAEIRRYLDGFQNLYPLGRNGMHRYNNQDHSMLTAMTVVDGLLSKRDFRDALWQINTDQDYHESSGS
jgi:protoporphyrinogen oxidase